MTKAIVVTEHVKDRLMNPPQELSRAQQHIYIDWRWKTKQPLLWRVVYRLFRKPIRRIISTVLNHAYERSIIDSNQLHKMHDIASTVMQPQKPVFYQEP